MSKELEKIKKAVALETFDLEQNEYIDLLRELANWAENEAGKMEFSSADVPDYIEDE